MAEKSSFFNARLNGTTYDRVYKAEDFANYFSTFVGNGVFANPTNNLQVVTKSGMTVILKSGKAFINGYFYENTEDLEIALDSANGTLKRIDRIVLRLDYLNREIKAYVLKGIPSSSAVATSITRNSDMYEISLCDITINSGVTEITQSSITDNRYDDSTCGIVKGLVDEIDTTDLFNQFTTVFNELKSEEKQSFNIWFNELKSQLDNNQATNLQNQLDKIHNDDLFIISNFITNGNFETTDNWIATRGTLTVSNNVGVFTTDTSTGAHYIRQSNLNINFKKGDKIFISFDLVSNPETYKPVLSLFERINNSLTLKFTKDFETSTVNERMIYNISADTNGFQVIFYLKDTVNNTTNFTGTGAETLKVSNVICINLTEVFGKGNEPTVEEMDRIMTYYNGFIDDTEHLLDRNNKVNTDFFNNKIIIPKLEVEDGLGVTKQNNTFKDYFYFNVESNSSTGAYNGTIGLRHYDTTINDTSYMGLIFNKTATTTNEIIPFVNNSTSLGKQGESFRDIFIGDSSISENGYTKLTNGLILQWGATTVTLSNSSKIVEKAQALPIQFPNEALVAFANAERNIDTANYGYLNNVCANAFISDAKNLVIIAKNVGSLDTYTVNFKVNWLVIGY